MKRFFDFFKVNLRSNEGRTLLCNYLPQRGARYQESLKWVKPEKKTPFHPAVSGDLASFPKLNLDAPYAPYENSKELETADEKVKRLFSLRYHLNKNDFENYKKELVNKIKNHEYDNDSLEVQIASYTAAIRHYQKIISSMPNSKSGRFRRFACLAVAKRKKQLKQLRMMDYRKFEWLLEKLDLEYRPPVEKFECKVTRKRSLVRLAKLKVEQDKEEKLAALKKVFDEQKVPFLEKKVKQLQEIKEMEEKYNLPATVSEEDISEVIKKIEKIKVEVDKRVKIGYKRKIHPFFLVPYDEQLLREKEKAGELIKQKLELENQKKMAEKSK